MTEEDFIDMRNRVCKKYSVLEQFTIVELYLFVDIINWVIEDVGSEEKGFNMMNDAMTYPDGNAVPMNLLVSWLKNIMDLVAESDPDTIYPNALGLLRTAKQEYERE